MGAARFILALDQGTTSSRSLLFDARGRVVALAQREFTQHFPQPGWVEHDALEIWDTQRATMVEVLARSAGSRRATSPRWASPTSAKPRCCGIAPPANPSRPPSSGRTGAPRPPANAARGRARTRDLARTGLLLDPYFSGTKLAWLLDHVPGARARAERGELAFGTIDSWLLFKLTAHRRHVTDATNASRTLLYNLHHGRLGRPAARTVARAARLPAGDRRHLPGARRRASRSTSTASNYR